jgi:hypothetical protein
MLTNAEIDLPQIKTNAEGIKLPGIIGDIYVFTNGPGRGAENADIADISLDVDTGALLHKKDNDIFSVECASYLKKKNKTVVVSKGGSAIVISLDNKDICKSKRLLVKMRENDGSITIYSENKFEAQIVNNKLENLSSKIIDCKDGKVYITFDKQQQPYWTLLEGKG